MCKRNHVFLGFVSFLVGLVLSAGGCGSGSQSTNHKTEIENVLAQDYRISNELRNAQTWIEHLAGMSPDKIDNYVLRLRNLDLSRCPKDFRESFEAHIYAWEKFAKIRQQVSWLQMDSPAVKTAIERVRVSYDASLDVAQYYGVDVDGYRPK